MNIKTKYFPPDPIPSWPKRDRGWGASIPRREKIALDRLERPVETSRASVYIRSHLYRNGEPLVCLSCGAKTTPEGDLPCGH